jgi:hypothetical protein
MAPRAGFEPATQRLTAACSTTELPGIRGAEDIGVPLAEGQVYKVVGRSGRSPRFRSVDQVAGNEKDNDKREGDAQDIAHHTFLAAGARFGRVGHWAVLRREPL